MLKIFNEHLTVTIASKGAEVQEVINNENDHNYMWDKDPNIWNGISPTLFPVVGKSSNDEIRYKGTKYPFGNHGFARHSVFDHHKISNHEIEFILTSDMIAENSFPFKFDFRVNYKLANNALITTYKVINIDSSSIYFTLGAHPAFKCPFDSAHKLSDYYLLFNEDTILTQHEINENAQYTGNTFDFKLNNQRLDLEHNDVSGTFVFSNIKSEFISLCEKNSDRKITIDKDNFPYVAFWKKPEGEYLCIEPWFGKSDDVDFMGDFNQKKDIITLEKGKEWSAHYKMIFNY